MKIAVVGASGFVGNAVCSGFDAGHGLNHKLIKIDPRLGTDPSNLLSEKPDVVFICVPTPMGDDGVIDASIVKSVLETLSPLRDTLMVLKSTVTPDIVGNLANQYRNFVYNPEFLTEKNAVKDFLAPFMTVFGGNKMNTLALEQVYRKYSQCDTLGEVYHVTAIEASLIKYGVNSFLATKVAFWNQFEELAYKTGASYDVIKQAIGTDSRIGKSHMNVPGHDGRRGYGNACFAKDIPALVQYSGKSLSIVRDAWNYNVDVRNSYGFQLPREVEQHVTFKKI